mgnify:CR=1 FL=1
MDARHGMHDGNLLFSTKKQAKSFRKNACCFFYFAYKRKQNVVISNFVWPMVIYTGISSVVSVVRVAPYMGILYTDCKHAMGNTCI